MLEKDKIPVPVFEENPDFVKFYQSAWESAARHRKHIPGMPQDPYMDEAFCITEIWIWDSCFMSLFCKYAPDVFPGVETLRNFYTVLYGRNTLPKVIPEDDIPGWSGGKKGEPSQIRIHLADNPPLFAWAEYENAKMTGDRKHVEELLDAGYLQKHYDWFRTAKAGDLPDFVHFPVCLESDASGLGFHWEGGRSGMDNTPRGRTGKSSDVQRPSRPSMLWVDALAQQSLAARCIAKLAGFADRTELRKKYEAENLRLNRILNEHYWCEEDGFYYDIDAADRSFIKVVTPASFWCVLCGAADGKKLERMSEILTDPARLGGEIPLLSLSRSDGDFRPSGAYWRGSLWLPTAYETVKALDANGKYALATTLSRRILSHMCRTWQEYSPHTIWECYSPMKPEPAVICEETEPVRKDFCGWSALGPISLFLEDVIGIREADAFTRRLVWEIPEPPKGRIGVKNYRFGGITADLILENGVCTVTCDGAFTLILNGTEYAVKSGKSTFHQVF